MKGCIRPSRPHPVACQRPKPLVDCESSLLEPKTLLGNIHCQIECVYVLSTIPTVYILTVYCVELLLKGTNSHNKKPTQ